MTTAGRIPGLDGLRGLAVLLVVFGHSYGSLGPYAASVGVTVFFVLSGYLITGILLAENDRDGRISLVAFYARRGLRLYPALLAMLLVYPLFLIAVGDDFSDDYWPKAGISALYLSDFFESAGESLGALTHTWSLAVEEQFYLVWPAILLAILWAARGDRGRLTSMLATVVSVAFAWRLIAMSVFDSERVYYGPDTSFYALAAGCLLSSAPALVSRLRAAGWIGGGVILGSAVLPIGEGSLETANALTVVTTLASMAVVSWAATGSAALELGVLRYFGAISYALYLWHLPLLNLGPDDSVPGGAMRVLAVVGSVVLAEVSARLVEAPALRLKRRFERGALDTQVSSSPSTLRQ